MKQSNIETDHKDSFLVVIHDFGDPESFKVMRQGRRGSFFEDYQIEFKRVGTRSGLWLWFLSIALRVIRGGFGTGSRAGASILTFGASKSGPTKKTKKMIAFDFLLR